MYFAYTLNFSLKMRMFLYICLIMGDRNFKQSGVSAFPPSPILGEGQTKSHFIINFYGIYISAYDFIKEHNLVDNPGTVTETINDFFGIDRDSQTHFLQNIYDISNHQSKIQRDFSRISHYHVNGEGILTAHNYIRSLRQSLIELAGQAGADVDIMRQRVGECLYTLQQFYSNTNWVDLFGEDILKEFGISSSLPVQVSGLSEEPCSDCPTDSTSLEAGLCMNNTLTSKLTSGYRSGQDVSKPLGNNQGVGKCSHGTPDDKSRLKSATGGIYKGRSISAQAPHFILHNKAFEAAKKATIYFLSNKDEGLFGKLGFDLTREVFKIKSKKERKEVKDISIAFVVDVTGSMGDNIAGVIQGTTRFVNQIKQSEQVPEKYILVTFSDPVTLETSRETSDPDEMIGWLNSLTVNGGDDCPEYSLSGLITGGSLSNNDSNVYIYTDAPAKDYEKENEVINVLLSKNLTAKFRLRNECTGRRRRDTVDAQLSVRHKRQSNVYDRIAAATGGDVQRFATASELADKVEEDLMNDLIIIQNSSETVKNEFPSSVALIKWCTLNTNGWENVTIEVDETVESLLIEINGTSNSGDILLRNPNEVLMTHASDNVTVQHTGILTTISVQSPQRGIWTLENVGSSFPLNVNITTSSSFDVSSALSEMTTVGIIYPVNGNPIKDKEYVIVVQVENMPANSSVSSIVLVDVNGQSVTSLPANLLSSDPTLQYFAKTKILTQISGVQLHGTDSSGLPFIRTSSHVINPVDVTLTMKPYVGDLPLQHLEELKYNMTNFGGSNKTLTVSLSDNKGYLVGNSSFRLHLPAGESTEESLYIRGTEALSIVTIVIELKDDETELILQTLTLKLAVSSKTRPYCNVVSSGDTCQFMEKTGSNCNGSTWTGRAQIGFSGGSLASVFVSTSTVNITHERLNIASSPLNVSLRGDCCTQSLVLTAIDQDGFIARCPFVVFSDNSPPLIKDSTAPMDQENAFKALGAVIGGVAALIVIAVVVVILRMYKNAKVNTKNTNCSNDGEDNIGMFMNMNIPNSAPPVNYQRKS